MVLRISSEIVVNHPPEEEQRQPWILINLPGREAGEAERTSSWCCP